ncbi:hypothetical protein Agabi119p4_5183 [Agaricus bisporus var. burnettii]|uniref:DUF6534 domain-containing protein n=1 Tax=Agaricus bisporus var. burnettii TaxID=192524 RepID=A0A8H7KI09_AGABI|nr:hypothetical protein Agabi119p4_5183 [Agaricus bisporus var. burnettii]
MREREKGMMDTDELVVGACVWGFPMTLSRRLGCIKWKRLVFGGVDISFTVKCCTTLRTWNDMSTSLGPELLNNVVTDRRGPLIGNLLNVLLYGILTVQTYLYYVAFPNDRKITKAIVGFVYSIDTVQTILALYDFYLLFCIPNNYHLVLGPKFQVMQDGFMWLTIPLSGTLVATVTQLFYAHRIYILSKKKIVTSIVIVLALGQLVFGIGITIVLLDIPFTLSMVAGWGPVGMTCDFVIAVYMSWFLTKQMRRSSRTTQVLVTRIKRLVLETGFLTAAFATAFTLFFIFVGHQVCAIPGLTLGKVYSNSLLVLFNNRFTIAGGRNEPAFEFEVDSYHLSDLPRSEGAEHGIRE